MFDFPFLDEMPDEMVVAGGLRTAIFDKRVLIPLAQLPEWVERETGEALAESRIPDLVRAGWFPVLASEFVDVAEGFPMYVPSRVGLFLRLEREGFTTAELEAFADVEESVIDDLLVDEDMPYEDDDLKLLQAARQGALTGLRDQLVYTESHGPGTATVAASDRQHVELIAKRIAALERNLQFLDRCAANGGIEALPLDTQVRLRRNAMRARYQHEAVRLYLVQRDRAQLGAGYSHFIQFGQTRNEGLHLDAFTFTDIDWRLTLIGPWAGTRDADDALPIRLPGVVLKGDQITMTRPAPPQEYKRLWEQYDLDGYLRTLTSLQGERRCLKCWRALPANADPKRRYCGEACRSAARAAAYRQRHPDWVNMDRHGVPRTGVEPKESDPE